MRATHSDCSVTCPPASGKTLFRIDIAIAILDAFSLIGSAGPVRVRR